MAYDPGTRVDVRASTALAWRPGEVQGEDERCVAVVLDTEISADDWSGVTRRYGGSDLVGGAAAPVMVYTQVESVVPGELIRPEGG